MRIAILLAFLPLIAQAGNDDDILKRLNSKSAMPELKKPLFDTTSPSKSESSSSRACFELEELSAEKGEIERWRINCGDGNKSTVYRKYGEKKFSFTFFGGSKREGLLDAMGGYSTRSDAAKVACGCRN